MSTLKSLALSTGVSFASLDVLANAVPMETATGSPDDLKKFAIASLTSLLTQALLKLIDNVTKKRRERRQAKNNG